MLRDDHLVAFQHAEPRCFRFHQSFEFFQRSQHHGTVLLGASNGGREGIDHAEPLGSQPEIVQHYQHHAETEQQVSQQIDSRRNMGSERCPVQMQGQHAQCKQPWTNLSPSPAEAYDLNSRNQCDQAIGNLQRQAQVPRIWTEHSK